MKLQYKLVITAPDGFDIPTHDNYDMDTLDEIIEGAEPHDLTLEAQVQRWLGGAISDAEADIAAMLPDGWSAKVEEA